MAEAKWTRQASRADSPSRTGDLIHEGIEGRSFGAKRPMLSEATISRSEKPKTWRGWGAWCRPDYGLQKLAIAGSQRPVYDLEEA